MKELLIIALILCWSCSETDGPASKRSGVKGQPDGDGSTDTAAEVADDDTSGATDNQTADDGQADDEASTDAGAKTDGTADGAGDAAEETDTDGSAEGDDTPPVDAPCAGAKVGGGCWYLQVTAESCVATCAPHGGYSEITKTYAGSDGTIEHCKEVVAALITDHLTEPVNGMDNGIGAFGCAYTYGPGGHYAMRFNSAPTTGDAVYSRRRACACNN